MFHDGGLFWGMHMFWWLFWIVLFPPFGLLAAIASASPWPISGSPLAFLTGFVLFTAASFVLGAHMMGGHGHHGERHDL